MVNNCQLLVLLLLLLPLLLVEVKLICGETVKVEHWLITVQLLVCLGVRE
jgi:hypothetical protein